MICCVIPTYKASATIIQVVSDALLHADHIVVVDDCCPEESGKLAAAAFASDNRITVHRHERNGGVGAAMKSGIAIALELDADIIVKIDSDGQMLAPAIDDFARVIWEDPSIAYVKGNRFVNSTVLQKMPKLRLIGNSILSLFVKFSSGYWNMLDPTNGFIAFNARLLRSMNWQAFANTYFFEISVLCILGLSRANIAEVEVPTIYDGATSSLAIRRVVIEFPPKLLGCFLRRIFSQYVLYDINLGSLYIVFGFLLLLISVVISAYEVTQTAATGHARSPGSVMLAVIPLLMGFQLLLNALMYDVQFGPRTSRIFPEREPYSDTSAVHVTNKRRVERLSS